MRVGVVSGSLVLLALAHPAAAQEGKPPELVASTEALTPEQEKAAFHLPPGFEAQLVAAEPFIAKPMNLAFDSRGRLWVTSSLEYPFPVGEGEKGRDRVTILSDFAEDGRALTVEQFTSGLNIPIGIQPLSPSEALVYSIPTIDRIGDTDGDGKADSREVLYSKFGFRDTHGMSSSYNWGFDGWVYATHGFSNTSEVKGSDGQPVTMNSGNTYRIRPDGSHLEQWTWGQVNPFGLCFDSLGNLYSSDCHSRPLYNLIRGAYYPSFGKPHDGLGFGPEMVQHDHGSTGIAGIVAYDADHYPEPYRGTMFVGNPVTSRINHDQLEWRGSSPQGIEQPDFLISDDPWFRPVDLELGPDGALYVADFYNKIIGHYEVPLTHPGRDRARGRIWRIVYRGEDGQAPPPAPARADWTRATLAELASDLGHANLAVRLMATHELTIRGGETAVETAHGALADQSSPTRRTHAMWVLERLGALGDDRLEAVAHDPDRLVRVHAQHLLSDRSGLSDSQRELILGGLADSDPFVRRAAAEALGRHPGGDNIRPLLTLLREVEPRDTHLKHTARIALRDQLLTEDQWAHLPEPMDDRDREFLADVAPGVPSAAAAGYLLDHITHRALPQDQLLLYAQHVARYGAEGTAPTLLAFSRGDRPEDTGHQLALVRAVHQGTQERGASLSADGNAWAGEIARRLLGSAKPEEVQQGIELVGAVRLPDLAGDLTRLANRRETPEPQRIAAMDANVSLDAAGSVPTLSALLATADEAGGVRNHAAEALGRIDRDEARESLLSTLPLAPSGLQRGIAVALSTTKAGSEALLEAVKAGKASPRVLQESPVQIRMNNAGISDLEKRVNELTAGLPPADEAMQAAIDRRRQLFNESHAEAAAGKAIFQKTCAPCHQVGGEGAKVGPQLDGVGVRGLDRILEDVLDPNRNVDQAFRSTTLALADGRVINGLLLREEGDVLVMADAQGKEQRISSSEVDERKVVPLSPMPANVVEPLSETEFSQLLAYLLSQRVAAPQP